MTTENTIAPTEIIRRLQQKSNGSVHIQRSANMCLLVAMQIKLKSNIDWRLTDFIEELTTLLDSMVRDYEPLARPALASEAQPPAPATLTTEASV